MAGFLFPYKGLPSDQYVSRGRISLYNLDWWFITDLGDYNTLASEHSQYIHGGPLAVDGLLSVMRSAEHEVQQIAYNNGQTYQRNNAAVVNGGQWTPWVLVGAGNTPVGVPTGTPVGSTPLLSVTPSLYSGQLVPGQNVYQQVGTVNNGPVSSCILASGQLPSGMNLVPQGSGLLLLGVPPSAGNFDSIWTLTGPYGTANFGVSLTVAVPTGTPTGSTPTGSTPVGSTPTGSTPVGSTPVGSTPVGSPTGSTPVGSPVGVTPVGSPVGSTPVGTPTGVVPTGSPTGVTPVGSPVGSPVG